MGAVAAVALGTAGARAATETYNISGTFGNSVNSCFNIAVSLNQRDCSYARTRTPVQAITDGPKIVGAIYARGSTGDNVNYVPSPGDGKASLPVSGTVTIDDNGTPADGSDDLISATWIIGAGAHNATTGNGDRAVERWDTFTHVMAATPVNAAVALGSGGFEYLIGSRGKPTPSPLCAAANPSDCFPSENAPQTQDPPGFWDATFSTPNPASLRNGIERTTAFGLFPGGVPNPNIGGQTTGTLAGYECVDNTGDNDCVTSEGLFGSSLTIYRNENGTVASHPTLGNCNDGLDNDGDTNIDAADPQCVPLAPSQPTGQTGVPVSPPGFENVILVLATDGAGAITVADAFWTREYVILSGPSAVNDPAGVYTMNNSYGGGRIAFTGTLPQSAPTAVADSADVIEDTATSIGVLANDTRGSPEPNTVTIESQPANGSAAVNGENVVYTPDLYYSGIDTFQYRVTDGDDEFSVATVTVDVSEKVPDARDFNASSTGGNPTAAIPVLGAPTVLGTGAAADHTVGVTGLATGGTCAISGSGASQAVTYTPTAGFNGVGFCEFSVTDADGDPDNARLNVSVSGNAGGGGGGGPVGPQLPSGGSSVDLLTLAALLAGVPLLVRRRRTTR
jgi:hypothetical protein